MNKLTRDKQAQVIAALVEGNSIRATVRMTGVSKDAIARLLVSVGNASMAYQDRTLRNLKCKRIQCDEAWSFCYAKDINLPASKQGKYGYGSVWTWVAIDADSKLVPSFRVGNRDFQTAKLFIDDLASRLANRVQLTSDGLKVYLEVVENAFGCEVDYAMLVKLFGSDPQGDEKRYSPAVCTGCRKQVITGAPDANHISTSYSERQNLTMRMQIRRFTRLTNAFSKKFENLVYSVAIHYMHYNFCRVHQTLRVTPAMEAGVSDHVWTIHEMLSTLDAIGLEEKAA